MIHNIWIDADSCPVMVRIFVVNVGNKLNIPVNFVANKKISCQNSNFNMIICDNSKDSADNYIIEHCSKEDLVITRDLLFAKRLLEKEIIVINDRGTLFTKENILPLIKDREYNLNLAQIGLVKHYNEGYNKEKFQQFVKTFQTAIHKI